MGNPGQIINNIQATLAGGGSTPSQVDLDNNFIYSIAELINAADSDENNPLLLIKNPSGSGKKIYIINTTGNSTISNERTLFGFWQNPTITTDGTSVTISSRNLGGGASSSSMNIYKLPTISASGTAIAYSQSGENTNESIFVIMNQALIQPGENVLITGKPKSNNRVQTINLVWKEVDV